jgi:hypothetical protein
MTLQSYYVNQADVVKFYQTASLVIYEIRFQ